MNIYIIGAGGLGREIERLVRYARHTDGDNIYFLDDYKEGLVNGREVKGKFKDFPEDGNSKCIIGVGDPQLRAVLGDRIPIPYFVNVMGIHVIVPDDIRLGRDVVVQNGCILTDNVEIGHHSYINVNVTIGHDVGIGNCCVLNPGANVSGNVNIGDRVLVGVGAVILQGLNIGSDAVVGAGAVVTKDVPDGETWVGNPAKKMIKTKKGDNGH